MHYYCLKLHNSSAKIYGEEAGGGIPDIYQVWADQGWNSPVVEEFYNPDRTRLSLDFRPKQAKKTNEENKRRKQAKKTSEEERRLII